MDDNKKFTIPIITRKYRYLYLCNFDIKNRENSDRQIEQKYNRSIASDLDLPESVLWNQNLQMRRMERVWNASKLHQVHHQPLTTPLTKLE